MIRVCRNADLILDLCDDLSYEEAVDEHNKLSEAMDVVDTKFDHGAKISDRMMKMKKYMANCLLEALSTDRPRALRMINSYRHKWLDVMERHDTDAIQTLHDYLVFRNLNGGME